MEDAQDPDSRPRKPWEAGTGQAVRERPRPVISIQPPAEDAGPSPAGLQRLKASGLLLSASMGLLRGVFAAYPVRARPKSQIFKSQEALSSRLLGLRSRCRTPAVWMYLRPRSTCERLQLQAAWVRSILLLVCALTAQIIAAIANAAVSRSVQGEHGVVEWHHVFVAHARKPSPCNSMHTSQVSSA